MSWPNTVRKNDLRIDYYKGSGAGGQKRNKTSSACRITHIETGISAQCEDHRSQKQNRETAFRRLADKLVPLMKQEVAKERYLAGHERIRTYNEPQDRVTDHRIPQKQWGYYNVIEGNDLADITNALCKDKDND